MVGWGGSVVGPDVTLALVDANVLACWEDKVKLGLECSLLLKHSEGKLLAFSGSSVQAFFTCVLGWVTNMSQCHDPKIEQAGSSKETN